MQDKEFDQLFRSKLENFEEEPTSQVWDGIVEELDGKHRYRSLLPWLSIAASITLLAAAGILFIPQKHTRTKPPVDASFVKTSPKPAVVKPEPLKVQPQSNIQPAPVVNNIVAAKHKKTASAAPSVSVTPAPVVTNTPLSRGDQAVLAVAQPKQDIITPVVPNVETPLSIKPPVDEVTAAAPEKITATANTLPVADKPLETDIAKPKRSTHGIGGFLNAVIAKVDKRKTKIIEFTDADDDETNVLSVNLGIFKSKKENDK